MNKKNEIAWAKWTDILSQTKEAEYTPEKDVVKFDNDPNDIFTNDNASEDESDENPIPVILTPIGILNLKMLNHPEKSFNFWMAETNFDITGEVVGIINDIPGVEILDVFTRYRFRICIGNRFKFQDVRQSIEAALNASPLPKSTNMSIDDETKAKIQEMITNDLSKFPYWAVYVCPNGNIDVTKSQENSQEFTEKLNLYVNSHKLAGGAIFKYDETITLK
jgi:hypothetical protein